MLLPSAHCHCGVFFRSGTHIEQLHSFAGAKVSMLVLAAACIVIGLLQAAVEFLEPACTSCFKGLAVAFLINYLPVAVVLIPPY